MKLASNEPLRARTTRTQLDSVARVARLTQIYVSYLRVPPFCSSSSVRRSAFCSGGEAIAATMAAQCAHKMEPHQIKTLRSWSTGDGAPFVLARVADKPHILCVCVLNCKHWHPKRNCDMLFKCAQNARVSVRSIEPDNPVKCKHCPPSSSSRDHTDHTAKHTHMFDAAAFISKFSYPPNNGAQPANTYEQIYMQIFNLCVRRAIYVRERGFCGCYTMRCNFPHSVT